jgi:arsenate reductase
MADRMKVLFLCTGNSCRSQMAEALVNHQMADEWQAFSAGTEPAGEVNPKALAALQEIGIEHVGRSKSADEFRDTDFDVVITVCDDAAENCPLWLGKGRKVHKAFRDPAKAEGRDAEVMQVFRDVLGQIEIEIPKLLYQIKDDL